MHISTLNMSNNASSYENAAQMQSNKFSNNEMTIATTKDGAPICRHCCKELQPCRSDFTRKQPQVNHLNSSNKILERSSILPTWHLEVSAYKNQNGKHAQTGTFTTYPTYDFRHIFKWTGQVNIMFPFKVNVFATKLQLGNEINNTNQIWNPNKLVTQNNSKRQQL